MSRQPRNRFATIRRRNEELIAEAAASGELDAPPEPPPAPQRAWDQEAVADSTEWDSIVKIDAGAAADAESTAAPSADDDQTTRDPETPGRIAAARIRLTSLTAMLKSKTVALPGVGSEPNCCCKKNCRMTNLRVTTQRATVSRETWSQRVMAETVTARRRFQSRTVW